MYSYGPPHMAGQKQDNQHEHIFSSYVRIRDVALKTCHIFDKYFILFICVSMTFHFYSCEGPWDFIFIYMVVHEVEPEIEKGPSSKKFENHCFTRCPYQLIVCLNSITRTPPLSLSLSLSLSLYVHSFLSLSHSG